VGAEAIAGKPLTAMAQEKANNNDRPVVGEHRVIDRRQRQFELPVKQNGIAGL